jgi:glycosyltransferase involved in cell wall biosynthesis
MRELVDLAIFFRNYFDTPNSYCHVGLGINAVQTERVLRRAGVDAHIFGVPQPGDILKKLQGMRSLPKRVVIEAIWVDIPTLKTLLAAYPDIEFLVRTHSQVGFLQVEPPAVKILREMLALQSQIPNLGVSANTTRLATFLERAYLAPCVFLPNLYDAEHTRKHVRDPAILRIAGFGALRLLKNHMSAAAAALLVARHLHFDRDGRRMEYWLNVNREENAGAKGILTAIRNLYAGLPWAKLVEHPWEEWSRFRKTMGRMDLYLQPSFTETFNITVADAIAEGVPVVVSDAIDWAPRRAQAEADSVEDIAWIGVRQLENRKAPEEALSALRHHVDEGVRTWLRWLNR